MNEYTALPMEKSVPGYKFYEREQPHLNPLPHQSFDTSYRIYRNVYKDCTVHFESNRYILPHSLVGEQVILRVENNQIGRAS